MTRRLAGRQRGDEILNDRHAGLLPAFAGAINCINLAVELVQRFLSCPIRQAVVRRDVLRVLGGSRSIHTRDNVTETVSSEARGVSTSGSKQCTYSLIACTSVVYSLRRKRPNGHSNQEEPQALPVRFSQDQARPKSVACQDGNRSHRTCSGLRDCGTREEPLGPSGHGAFYQE